MDKTKIPGTEKKTKSLNLNSEVQSQLLNLDLNSKLHELLKNQFGQSFKAFLKTSTPLILTGHQGLPILEAAKALAKQRFCFDLCLNCNICKSIDEERFYQVQVIRPEGRVIKVDQIRDVIERLSYKNEQLRVVIFDQVHLMNAQASNALLKTLEEPPENCWMILTSPSIKNVLSTIRSRCLVFKLKALDYSSLNHFSQDSDLKILQGRWDWIQNSEDVLHQLEQTKNWFYNFKADQDMDLPEGLKGKEGLGDFLTYLRLILKSEVLTNGTPMLWVNLVDRLQDLESALQMNVDVKLIEDHLISAMKEYHATH